MAQRWVCFDDEELNFIRSEAKKWIGSVSASILKKIDKAQQRIKTSSAKGKGAELQKWMCQKIADLLGLPFDNQDDQCLIHSREMGQSGLDVILRGSAYKDFPFDVECKSTETLSMTEFIRQARSNTKSGRHWMVVYRSKVLRDPVIMLSWDALEELYAGRIGARRC